MARRPKEPKGSEITDERSYWNRRELLKNAGLFVGTAAAVGGALWQLSSRGTARPGEVGSVDAGAVAPASPFRTNEPLTAYEDITTYNNFYELGLGKADPARNAEGLRVKPWSIEVSGEIAKPGVLHLEDLLHRHPSEERVYRMRCVEGWSMVIPWLGFPLGDLVKRLEPTSRAKYVAFTTLHDPERMPGQRSDVLEWPYVEGLRIDEAVHPLTMLAVGLYGKPLLGQNGAPLRLVVPWKYGFKGIKSIVRIHFTPTEPPTSWSQAAPHEYGFSANVNPAVDHPRWSQATERRIGEFRRRPTLPFNGYADEVASLYAGMDLRKHF